MTAPPASHAQPRFLALDSLRGLLALFVVLFHLPVDSHVRDLPLVMHGYLFVDYFFVLSGFVIAHSYGSRIEDGRQGRDFLIKRVARVWPLHAVMLGLFVLLEVVRPQRLDHQQVGEDPPRLPVAGPGRHAVELGQGPHDLQQHEQAQHHRMQRPHPRDALD